MNKFHSKSLFIVQFVCKCNRVSLGTQLTVSYIVLYCNMFVILFTQIIHKKANKKFNLTVWYVEKYNSIVEELASSE